MWPLSIQITVRLALFRLVLVNLQLQVQVFSVDKSGEKRYMVLYKVHSSLATYMHKLYQIQIIYYDKVDELYILGHATIKSIMLWDNLNIKMSCQVKIQVSY